MLKDKLLYVTKEWKGYGKQNYFRNEYRLVGGEVVKSLCRRFKLFDGKENTWMENTRKVTSWALGDSNMPGWLHKFL